MTIKLNHMTTHIIHDYQTESLDHTHITHDYHNEEHTHTHTHTHAHTQNNWKCHAGKRGKKFKAKDKELQGGWSLP